MSTPTLTLTPTYSPNPYAYSHRLLRFCHQLTRTASRTPPPPSTAPRPSRSGLEGILVRVTLALALLALLGLWICGRTALLKREWSIFTTALAMHLHEAERIFLRAPQPHNPATIVTVVKEDQDTLPPPLPSQHHHHHHHQHLLSLALACTAHADAAHTERRLQDIVLSLEAAYHNVHSLLAPRALSLLQQRSHGSIDAWLAHGSLGSDLLHIHRSHLDTHFSHFFGSILHSNLSDCTSVLLAASLAHQRLLRLLPNLQTIPELAAKVDAMLRNLNQQSEQLHQHLSGFLHAIMQIPRNRESARTAAPTKHSVPPSPVPAAPDLRQTLTAVYTQLQTK